MDQNEAIKKLQNFTVVGPDTTTMPDPEKMRSTIEEVERTFGPDFPAPLADALANAILCYTAWYVRGDDRKSFLERAVRYYRLSGNKAALGRLLVEEAQVRDLKQAIPLLEELYTNTKTYDPALCFYADALYKDGQFIPAYEAALHIHRLAEKTKKYWDARMEQLGPNPSGPEYRMVVEHFMGSVPTMPMQVAAKSLRAEARRLKKAGQQQEAITMLTRLRETGQATANDIKELERLTGA